MPIYWATQRRTKNEKTAYGVPQLQRMERRSLDIQRQGPLPARVGLFERSKETKKAEDNSGDCVS